MHSDVAVPDDRTRLRLETPLVGLLLVLAATGISFIIGLGDAPLARTEGHRAVTAHQMAESGQWIVPRLFGSVYLTKPPLHYWTLAATEIITGTANEFVWRLPSAIAAVLTCVLLWWSGRRWFGPFAGLVSGLAGVAIVALWSQSRSADIDALHTLAVTAAALGLIEIGFGGRPGRWRWMLGCGAALGAVLLSKGPAGLPVIGGVLLGSSIATRRWRWLTRWSCWGALLIGAALFLAWVVAVRVQLAADDLARDTSGVAEVADRLTPDAGRALLSLATPLVLAFYALPVALALPFGVSRPVHRALDERQRRLMRALCGGFLGALVLFAMCFVVNPRYGYIAFPLLGPIAGAVGELWRRGTLDGTMMRRLRQCMTGCVFLFGAAAAMLPLLHWSDRSPPAIWIGFAILAGTVTVIALAGWIRRRVRAGAWGLLILVLFAAIAFGGMKSRQLTAISSRDTGLQLRGIVGASATLHVELLAQNHPVMLFYADLDIVRPSNATLVEVIDDIQAAWVLFDHREWEALPESAKRRAKRIRELDGPDDPILAWMDASRESTASQ